MGGYLLVVLVLGLWAHALVDCLNTPEDEVRQLPKVVWEVVIVLTGAVVLGPAAWFAVGRPRRERPADTGRPWGPGDEGWVAPDDNPAFLRSLDEANRARRQREFGPAEGLDGLEGPDGFDGLDDVDDLDDLDDPDGTPLG